MKIIKPYFIIEDGDEVHGVRMLKKLEKRGRNCYKSEGKITRNSYFNFVKGIIKKGHESVIEHEKITVKVVCDRGISHEIVRHRLGSYSQESTRYCNYSEEGIIGVMMFIEPFFFVGDEEKYKIWREAMEYAEKAYNALIKLGAKPQEARTVLPHSLKAEIDITYNLREWRHFFEMRCSAEAHPQMREVTIPLLLKFQEIIPVIFDDFKITNEKEMIAEKIGFDS